MIRMGLIGFGGLARQVHAPVLKKMDGVNVVAVADADTASRKAASACFPDASFYDDYAKLLNLAEVEAVVIALPTQFHLPAALEAIRRHKHFYLEKPMALSVAEAQTLTEAWQDRGLVGMMGFNQRFHPLHQRLRQEIASGRIGQPLAVQTAFCTPARPLASWRSRRTDGGGALMELACHHIDLATWLFNSPVRAVRSSIRGVISEADTATLYMWLDCGVEIQSIFSLSAVDEDRWEILGRRGKLSLDRYRSSAIRFSPAGDEFSLKTRLNHCLSSARGFGYALSRRHSPAREPSFVPAMAAFIAAVQGGMRQGADLRDGLHVCQVIDSAERSMNSGQLEPVQQSPRCSAESTRFPAATAASQSGPDLQQHSGGEPQLSVILSTPDTYAGLRRTVEALRRQTVASEIELLMAAPDRQKLDLIEDELKPFARWRVIEVGSIQSIASANAAAIRQASAPIIALGEDHAFPEPTWAEALLARHREAPYAAVGPVVSNANPCTLTSWADLLIGYGPWLESHPGGCVEFLPGHNSSYRRDILLKYGNSLEEMMQAETVLHWDLRSKGHRLYLEPQARLAHTNFGLLPVWLKVQFHAGRVFAATRAAQWRWTRRAAFVAGSPLIPAVRMKRIMRHPRPTSCPRMLRLLPVLLIGLIMDGLGQLAGYLLGAGGSRQKLSNYEFHRWRFAGPGEAHGDADPQAVLPVRPVVHTFHDSTAGDVQPQLSVILMTPDSFSAIRKTVRHLGAQTAADRIELLLIAPAIDRVRPEVSQLRAFAAVRVLEAGEGFVASAAKAMAVDLAAAPIVAFAEDHCYPEPQWAQALIDAHRGPWAAVGPVILNANPATMRSWANYIPCFGRWCEPFQPGVIDQTPWHNTSYKRDILLEYGSRLGSYLAVEGTLHEDLRRRGHQLYLQPAARTHHVNISRGRSVVVSAFHGGRIYGASRAANGKWSWRRRLLYIGGAPLIPPIRLRRELSTISRIGRRRPLLPRILPLLMIQLLSHAAGEACGYLTGAGDAERRYADYELYRRRHLARVDREMEMATAEN